MPRPKILFLEVAAGGGHKSITTAIIESINNTNPQIESIRIDPSASFIHQGYQIISHNYSYNLYFHLSNSSRYKKLLTPISNLSNTQSLIQHIKEIKPQAIVTNTLFGINKVPQILTNLNLNIPYFVFVPDPITPHAVYYPSLATKIFVASIEAFQHGIRLGIDPEKMFITGHPIRQDFFEDPVDIIKHKKELGLDPDMFTITMGGSGDGAEKTYQIIQSLKKINLKNIQLIILTGNNTHLAVALKKVKLPGIKLYILPSIGNVHEYLQASDLVAAKAGPNILFETIAAGKPFLATYHFRGQENGNLEFIKSTQVGFIEENPTRAAELLALLINNPDLLNQTQKGIKLIRSQLKPAANNIASEILKTIKHTQTDPFYLH